MAAEKLIASVQIHQCLYNNKIKEYKDSAIKLAAWEDISWSLKIPVSECKTKWNQLRNAFLHALVRRKASAQKVFKKWKYEDEMKFLLPFMTTGLVNVVSNVENNEKRHDASETTDEEYSSRDYSPERCTEKRKTGDDEDMLKILIEKRKCIKVEEPEIDIILDEFDTSHINVTPSIDNNEEISETMNKTVEFVKVNESYDKINEFHTLSKEKIQNKKLEKDDIDLLFESLAKTVKTLPKIEQIRVKMDMAKIVYEAEMRCENK